VVYRGEVFRGDHEAILDPALFAAVQAKLSSQAVERRCDLHEPAPTVHRDRSGHFRGLSHRSSRARRAQRHPLWRVAIFDPSLVNKPQCTVLIGLALGYSGFDKMFVTSHTRQTLFPYCENALSTCGVDFPMQQTLDFSLLGGNFLFQFDHSVLARSKLRRPIPVESHRELPG
jgi:hypothetical protein